MKLSGAVNALLLIFGSVIVLIYGQSLLFPLLAALLIYFLVSAFQRMIDKNKFIRKKIPTWLKSIVGALVIFYLIFLVFQILVMNIQYLAMNFNSYAANLNKIGIMFHKLTGIDPSDFMEKLYEKADVMSLVNPLLNSVSGFLGNSTMMLFYSLFIFLEQKMFRKKIGLIFTEPEQKLRVRKLINEIEHSITHYIGLKSLTSLISSVIGLGIMYLTGVDYPFLWAAIIFIMNFIPVIGSFLAVITPSLFALLQFGDFPVPLIVLFSLGFLRALMGNIIEPKLMGNSLNISPLVALFSLAFWGAIWGITGMIVSVPITVILIILMAHFPQTRPIAIMLSQNGKV